MFVNSLLAGKYFGIRQQYVVVGNGAAELIKSMMEHVEGRIGESQARNKYTYFASVAKKAGYEQIAALFLQTAENEKEHAKLWFKALGELGDTAENLLHAAEGERVRKRISGSAQRGLSSLFTGRCG